MGYESNIPSFNKQFDKNNVAFLQAVGALTSTSMKKRCPVGISYGGTLRQDIRYEINLSKHLVGIGNTLEYSVYVNKGTGQYTPGGRGTPWVYFDPKSGSYFTTYGQKPQPYIMEGYEKIKSQVPGLYNQAMKGFR